jgi:site-specific recombinase XerD
MIRKGTPSVLASDEARVLLDSIEASSLIGRRERALIALMVYTFARVNAVLEMKMRDYACRDAAAGCACTRKAASSTKCPAATILEKCLGPYITADKIADDPDAPLFRVAAGKSGKAYP